MNRLLINVAEPGACVPCGGLGKLRVDVTDFGIIGVFVCPACSGDGDTREFLAPLMDYLKRPGTPGSVIA